MTAATFTLVFLVALAASLAAKLWLARRQVRFVAAHRAEVPPAFADRIALAAHQKAADYTVARTRFGVAETAVEVVLLLALTLGGGLAALVAWTGSLGVPSLAADLALVVAVALVAGVVGLPFSYVNTFGIEAKFGFNRTTRAVWIADIAKGVAVSAALGLPLVALICSEPNWPAWRPTLIDARSAFAGENRSPLASVTGWARRHPG